MYTVEDTRCENIALIMIYINSQTLFPTYISLPCTNAFLFKSSHTVQFISVNEVITINLTYGMDFIMKAVCANALVIFKQRVQYVFCMNPRSVTPPVQFSFTHNHQTPLHWSKSMLLAASGDQNSKIKWTGGYFLCWTNQKTYCARS